MEHKNEIAIKLLRHEYADYDDNSWHYDREYKMLVEAQNLALAKESEVDTSEDKCTLHGVMHSPDWLHDNHKAEAIRLYKIRKVDGVKYLCDIARKHLVNPLKWSYDFLKGCA